MGMTNIQLNMMRALAENRIQDAKKYALACCEEDKTKKNEMRIERIRGLLKNDGPKELPLNLKGILCVEDVSDFQESRYFLGSTEREIFEKIEQTSKVCRRLQELGIPYLNSTLLYGLPGTGKTMFSRYVAHKLQLPFMYINFSYLIDSYLGKTSRNLKNVFEYCRNIPCVLMLDEIDCIGLRRDEGGDSVGGELARTTISLMQELDSLSNEQIVIAATNREDRLDPALSRRFFQKARFRYFEREDRMAMACKFLDNVGIAYRKEEVKEYTNNSHSQAEVIQFATQIVIREVSREDSV